LAWRNGQVAIQRTVAQLVDETSEHIVFQVKAYAAMPDQLNKLNIRASELGMLDLADVDLATTYFMQQLMLYEAITFIGFGSETGEFVGVNRLPGERFQQQIATRATGMALKDYLLDDSGTPTVQLNIEPDYDVRQRDWYQTARTVDGPVWGKIHPYVSSHGLALSINEPLLGEGGEQLLGVIGVGYDLSFISQFLSELEVGESGEALIIERNGDIVASSMNQTPYQLSANGSKRLSVFESDTKLVRLAVERLLEQVSSLEAIAEPLQTVVVCEGQRKFIQVAPVEDDYGLDWLTVVMVPESDFNQPLRDNSRTTALLCLVALAIAAGLGIMTTRYITKPLLALHHATTGIAQGQLEQPDVTGSSREINELAGAFNDMSGQLKRAFSDLQKANAALLKSEHRLHTFLEALPVGVVVLEVNGHPTYLNDAAKQLFDLNSAESWPASLMDFCQVYDDAAQEFCSQDSPCWHALAGNAVHSVDMELYQGQGRIPVETWATPVFDERGAVAYAIVVLQDISERKQAEEQLIYSARYDRLTHLPNRDFFMKRLVKVVAQKPPHSLFAVLFIDLDQFKLINDSLGHLAGDHVLVIAADRLRAAVRPSDMVARFGGDEFVILLEAISTVADAIQVAERILAAFEHPILIEGHRTVITASAGIAIGQAYRDATALLRDADIALYRAKAAGRARYKVFDPAMHQAAIAQMTLERDLRQAIERQEFLLYYQPIVTLKTRRLVGFEALARWRSPSGSLVSPTEFIATAETSGLIVDIDLTLIRMAVAQLAQWRRQYPAAADLTVAVNLSVHDIRSPSTVEGIGQILEETNLPGEALTLEITETVLLNLDDFSRLLPLKKFGVRISIDDFGTGYSSLSYLCGLPVDMLKIDQSFIHQVPAQPKTQMVVKTILSLGRQLHLLVTAEGIEAPEQLELLHRFGCRFGQGHLFSGALSAEAIAELLARPDANGTISL
ncbi:MAG: EAL domain-containing protein, partial [Cyanobacteria bacterium P01_A01_bin.135]